LEGEVGIGFGKRRYKSILKCLDGAFGRIDPVIVRFDELELAFLFGEIFLIYFVA
jgi:hypothetical protein